MKLLLRLIAIPPLLAAFASAFAAEATEHLVYPHPPKSDQVDDYFGTKVADPYRPLENADSKATRNWIEGENKLTFDMRG